MKKTVKFKPGEVTATINGNTVEVLEMTCDQRDAFFEDAAKLFVETQQASTALLQRKLPIGLTRAKQLMGQLQDAGIIAATTPLNWIVSINSPIALNAHLEGL